MAPTAFAVGCSTGRRTRCPRSSGAGASLAGHEAIHRPQEFTVDKPIGSIWLSQRARQCLEWAGAGKIDWEIGQILALHEKTMNVHINRAKSKFGVKTRAQAILRASKAGLIAV